MKKWLGYLYKFMFFAGLLLAQLSPTLAEDKEDSFTGAPIAVAIKVEGVISPATLDLIKRNLHAAQQRHADIVVLEMQTPGGLYDSMQQIIQAILDSPIPVATFVYPPGSHAASAGTYILLGSHIAAMAPSTVIGAATPIQMGREEQPSENSDPSMNKESAEPKTALERKMVNDAAAYIRGLAERYNRNGEWAEKAVREAVSITATEALANKSIDVIANDVPHLLEQIHGREVKMAKELTMKLNTKGAKIERIEADWRTELLGIIAHPNVAFMLMTLGSYGLIYECINPGAILPGVIGLICFILGLFAMNVLPVDYTGLALILVGIALMIGEAFAPAFGALGIGGAIAFAVGATMLFDSVDPNFGVDPWLVAGITLSSLAFFSVIVAVALRAQRKPTVTGVDELKTAIGEVLDWEQGQGKVRVTGEVWSASAASPELIINKGDKVKVVEVDGLRLIVQPE